MPRIQRPRPGQAAVNPTLPRLLPGLAGLVLGGLAGLVPGAAGAGEITGTGGPLSLGTAVNGQLGGSCGGGTCAIGGGTRAGANLFHRFSAFDTRGGIQGVRFDTQGQRLLVVGVTNPLGSFLDKPISFSAPASLIWLSPGGIHLGGGASFSNIPSLQLSTATGQRFAGGGRFDVFSTPAVGVSGLTGDPLAGSAGLVSDPAALQAAGLNANGDITAAGGLLTVDRSLLLDAQGGHVLLEGAQLQAPGEAGVGGSIALTGASVSLRGSRVDASGASGGGTVLVGGERAGGPGLTPAGSTLVDGASTIRADATGSGGGGTVVVWSENGTRVDGALSARGGPAGGDGGFIETSGRRQLAVSQAPDASAPQGKGGTWLLDPNNLRITGSGPDSNVSGAPLYSTTADNAVVAAYSIANALNSGTSVTLSTSSGGTQAGTITLEAPILKTAGGDAALTFNAHGGINLQSSISSSSGKLDLTLQPDSDANGSGSLLATSLSSLDLNGGSLSLSGFAVLGGRINAEALFTSPDSALTLPAGGFLRLAGTTTASQLQGTLALTGGSLEVNGAGAQLNDLQFSAGSLAGQGQLALLGGTNTWSGGSLSGSRLTVASGATLTLNGGDKFFGDASLETEAGGTINWTSGDLRSFSSLTSGGYGGRFVVNAGSFDIQGDLNWLRTDNPTDYSNYAVSFINSGTLLKSAGTGVASLGGGVTVGSSGFKTDFELTNNGLVDVQSGTLRLSGAFPDYSLKPLTYSSGEFRASSPTSVIEFSRGKPGLQAGASLTGSGTNLVSGAYLYATDSTPTASNLVLTGDGGGALLGPGTLTITGSGSRWSGGPITQVTLNVAPGATLTLDGGDKFFGDAKISNQAGGTINWTSGALRTYSNYGSGGYNAGTFSNDGTFDIQGDLTWSRINSFYGGSNHVVSLRNWGSIIKSAGTGTASLGDGVLIGTVFYYGNIDLANTGLIDVRSGTLLLNSPQTFTQDGILNTATGTSFASTTTLINAGTISGNGTIDLYGGILFNSGKISPAGSVAAAPRGSYGVGQITINGTLALGPSSQLMFDVLPPATPGGAAQVDRLLVTGGITLGGSLALQSQEGQTLPVGATLDVLTSPSITGDFSNVNLPAGMSRGSVVPASPSPGVSYRLGQGSTTSFSCLGFCWDGGGGSDTHWSTAANWFNDLVPGGPGGSSDVVYFNLAAGATITLDDSRTIEALFSAQSNDLTIQNGGSLTLIGSGNPSSLYGRVQLEEGSSLAVQGLATAGGGFEQYGGSLSGSGTLALVGSDNALYGGRWEGGGTTRIDGGSLALGSFGVPIQLQDRSIQVTGGGSLSIRSTAEVIGGSNTISVDEGARLSFDRAPWTSPSGPTDTGLITSSGRLDLITPGTVSVASGVNAELYSYSPAAHIVWNGSGPVQVAPDSVLRLYGDVYNPDFLVEGAVANLSGPLSVPAGATLSSTNSQLTYTASPTERPDLGGALVVNGGSTTLDLTSLATPTQIGSVTLIDGTLSLRSATGGSPTTPTSGSPGGPAALVAPGGGDTSTTVGPGGGVSPSFSAVSISSFRQGLLDNGGTAYGGGTLTGSGALEVYGSFTRLSGAIAPFAFSRVTLVQDSGTLSPGELSVNGPVSFEARDGRLELTAPVVASSILGRGLAGVSLLGDGTLTATGLVGDDGTARTIGLAAGLDAALLPSAAPGGFLNTASAGAAALSVVPGARWELYAADPSSSPTSDLAGLPYAFKQYGKTPDDAVPVAGSGNGLFYAFTPSLSVSLVGSVSGSPPSYAPVLKTYDGTTSATLSASNYSLSGVVSGDTVLLNNPSSAVYDTRDVGVSKLVSVTGLAVSSAYETAGAVPVYGYALPVNSAASAAIGTIAKAPLTISAVGDSKVYDGTTSSSGVPSITAGQLFSGDSLSNLSQAYQSQNVLGAGGSTLLVTPGYSLSDGNGGGNYAVTLQSASGTINKAPAVVTANSGSTTYNGGLQRLSGFQASGLVGGDTAATALSGVSAGASGVNAGSYASRASGTAANYQLSFVDGAFTIARAPLTISAVSDSKVYDGTTSSTGVPLITAGQLFGSDSLSNLSQAYQSKNVLGAGGSTLLVTPGYSLSDGNGGANYDVTLRSASGTITPAAIAVVFSVNAPVLAPATGSVSGSGGTSGTTTSSAGVYIGQFQGVAAADSGKVALVVSDLPTGLEEVSEEAVPPGSPAPAAAGGSAAAPAPAAAVVGEEARNYTVTSVTVNGGGRSQTFAVTPLAGATATGAAASREQGSGGVAQRLNLVLDASQQQTLSTEQVQSLLGQAIQAMQQGGGP